MDPQNFIDSFSELQVAVLGDVVLDTYLEGHSRRLAKEAPVPVVDIAGRLQMPGGAANTAANLADLGACVEMLSVAGADSDWGRLSRLLADRGIDVGGTVTSDARRTIAKLRVVSGEQILLRIDDGSTGELSRSDARELEERLEAAWDRCDVLVVSDYACGVVTRGAMALLASLHRRDPGKPLVIDSGRLASFRDTAPTAVKPNYEEACALLSQRGRPPGPERVEHAREIGPGLLDVTGAGIVALTLDVAGSLVFQDGVVPYRTFSRPRPGPYANGAGDTFVAALALGLARGIGGQAAAELAQTAASVVVGKDRTTTCTAAALKESFSISEKVLSAERLATRAEYHRASGERVVFTNGCFDILHRGHITYLESAKRLGDVLIVAVNSDESVRRLKGPDRPVNPLEDRMQVIASLACVDHVVPFDEDTPVEAIRAARPDVFVKGGDYAGKDIPEAPLVRELGGEVRLLPFVPDTSTTRLIERIRYTELETAGAAAGGARTGGDAGQAPPRA